MNGIVENLAREQAPSTLADVGRYALTNCIFECLEKIEKGAGGEIHLTNGIAALMQREAVLAYRYAGTRYECDSKLAYAKAPLGIGLQHPETGTGLAAYFNDRD